MRTVGLYPTERIDVCVIVVEQAACRLRRTHAMAVTHRSTPQGAESKEIHSESKTIQGPSRT